ncbi:hypothetical protein ABIA39_007997 [Nocardia sp. GAS34]|uniref:hypothetical protein n=1 Tax=unclassified Nocardia TaxID=2637762 RepID=UPI003D212E56
MTSTTISSNPHPQKPTRKCDQSVLQPLSHTLFEAHLSEKLCAADIPRCAAAMAEIHRNATAPVLDSPAPNPRHSRVRNATEYRAAGRSPSQSSRGIESAQITRGYRGSRCGNYSGEEVPPALAYRRIAGGVTMDTLIYPLVTAD